MVGHSVSTRTRDKIAKKLKMLWNEHPELWDGIGDKISEKLKVSHENNPEIWDDTHEKISKSVKIAYKENPESHKNAIENMIGGFDVVKRHCLYDYDDLSKNMVEMTR